MRRRQRISKERLEHDRRVPDPVELRLDRARRMRARGETRRALVLIREACALDEWRARSFALLGALCADLGLPEEAIGADQRARWLRRRAGEQNRVRTIDRLLDRMTLTAA